MSAAGFFQLFMSLYLIAFMAVIGYSVITRRIHVAGLITSDGEQLSVSRLQLLMTTVSGLVVYASSSLSAGKLVEIPGSLVSLFALSHMSYIGFKVGDKLMSRSER